MATSYDLPTELVEYILDAAYYDYFGVPDYKTLVCASSVCTTWRFPAQRLLYHAVQLARLKSEAIVRFRSALLQPSTPRSRVLTSYVRRVDIILGYGPFSQCTLQDFVQLVTSCRGLYDVTLRVMGVHDLDEGTLEGLRRAHAASLPTPIRSLNLLVCGVQSPMLYQLLDVWPTVRFLRVGAELVALPPTEPVKVQLYELVLHRTPPPVNVEWLLAASQESLRIFDCHAAPGAEYNHLLPGFSQHLLSLRLFRHTSRSTALIQHCLNLRELIITQLSSFLPLGELPSTLEHLSFRSLSSVATIPLHSIISAVDNLPKLHLLTCDASTEQNPDFPFLKIKCQKRGVVLFSRLLPVPIFEDPVPLQTYPRGKSVLNFPFMNQTIC